MSQESTTRIQELEYIRTQNREAIVRAEKWEKLMKNPLFKELVLENYLEKLAVQLVQGFSNPSNGIAAQDVANSMIGISELKQYIDSIPAQKLAALQQVNAVDEELAYLRGEE